MSVLDGKQIALVVGQKNYDEKEFRFLFEALEEQGADVVVASNSQEKALGRLEGYVTPDVRIADLDASEYDAIVLVGGYGARVYLWNDEDTHQALRKFAQNQKLIAAISTAPVALAKAGVLEKRQATVYPDYESNLILEEAGAALSQKSLVVDGRIITAKNNSQLQAFVDAIVAQMKG